jgi:hypothetical protein
LHDRRILPHFQHAASAQSALGIYDLHHFVVAHVRGTFDEDDWAFDAAYANKFLAA